MDNKVGFFKSIQFKFVLIYTLLILLAMQIIGVYFSSDIEEDYMDSFRSSLENTAQWLSYDIKETISEIKSSSSKQEADDAIKEKIENQIGTVAEKAEQINEIIVVDYRGHVQATTDFSDNDRVGEITTNGLILHHSIELGAKTYSRRDPETGDRVAVRIQPINVDGDQNYLLYIEKSKENIYQQLRSINNKLASATAIALVVTAVLGVFLARTVTKPLQQMRRQAFAVSHGDFSRKVDFYDNDEIGQLAMAFNNMTDKLHEAQATTESERRKLRSILTYMTDGVIATNKNGHVILINKRSEQLLQRERKDLLGKSIVNILQVNDEYSVEDLYSTDESIILDFSTDYYKVLVRANFSVIRNEFDAVSGLIAVLHDVTEQEQIELERREFVANVSHELRTPLTTMKSYIEALADGAIEEKELAAKFLGVTQTEVDRMTRMVKDLLQLSKLDAKDYNFQKRRVNFLPFFENIIDRFEFSKRQNIEFVRELAKAPVYVNIDQDKLTQVIDNIISNAMKYSPEGGTIAFQLTKKGNQLKVSIKDEGVGIPKENLEKVFTRFYRVDKARSRKLGGTGLGLAIAKEIIEAHGGEIWADSEWKKGTTVSFTLPVSRKGAMDDGE